MPAPTSFPLDSFEPSDALSGRGGRKTSLDLQEPVFSYLDQLVEVARSRTTRQELIAALICHAQRDPQALKALIDSFRDQMTVADLGQLAPHRVV
jgi:hypothetical protein